MQRWVDRIAMVTGASSGIGAAITYQLLDNGVNVVALARRAEQIEEAVNNAKQGAKSRGRYQEPSRAPGKLHTRACDVTKEDDILSVFRWVRETLGGADILINNAGLGGDSPLTDTKTDVWKHMLDVNVVGLSVCTREAVQSMRARGVDDGHVVHICSIVGHAPPARSEMAMYGATKHAVRVLAEGLRKDFNANNNKTKISCVSPGFVKTGFVDNLPNLKAQAQELYDTTPHLFPEDIADAVLYCIGTPPHVQCVCSSGCLINELWILPVRDEDHPVRVKRGNLFIRAEHYLCLHHTPHFPSLQHGSSLRSGTANEIQDIIVKPVGEKYP